MIAKTAIRQRVQTCTLFFLGFTLGLFALSQAALAEDWQEIAANNFYFDSNSLFMDVQTGYVIAKTASGIEDGSYVYGVQAIDCSGGKGFMVAVMDDDGSYFVLKDWLTNPDYALGALKDGSQGATLGKRVCADWQNLPRNSIEQVYP